MVENFQRFINLTRNSENSVSFIIFVAYRNAILLTRLIPLQIFLKPNFFNEFMFFYPICAAKIYKALKCAKSDDKGYYGI